MIRKFLDYITIERHYSPLTVRAYEQDLKEFCSYLRVDPSALNPGEVSDADIKDWMISLLDAGEKPRTVRRKLSSLRSFWRFMLRVGYVDKDITRAIIAPKMDKPLPVFLERRDFAHTCTDDGINGAYRRFLAFVGEEERLLRRG